MSPRVLIGYSACQLTRQAFAHAGCDARTCDLLPARGDDTHHIQGDIWHALLSQPWDFAVVHPMCTYLTVSAAWALKDPDFKRYPGVGYHQKVKPGTLTGETRRNAQGEAIRNFRSLMALPFPVIAENPAPSFLNTAIDPPHQIIHPYEYGDDASKSTGLWFNPAAIEAGVPRLAATQYVLPRLVHGKSGALMRWANQTDSGQNRLSPSDDRWLERSATYPGIAAAMGKQWGEFLTSR